MSLQGFVMKIPIFIMNVMTNGPGGKKLQSLDHHWDVPGFVHFNTNQKKNVNYTSTQHLLSLKNRPSNF